MERSKSRLTTAGLAATLAFGLWGLNAASVAADHDHRLPPSAKQPTEPIVCSGNREVVLENRSIWSAGDGLVVSGNCEVSVVNSHIVAEGVGIRADGNAEVHVMGSFVQGGRGAVYADGNAEVNYGRTTFRGGISRDGNAEILDRGRNLFERIPGSGGSSLSKSEAMSCGDRDRLTVVHRYVETDGDGITVFGDCEVLLSDSYVRAGKSAVRVVGDGVIRVRNSTLDGGEHAVVIESQGEAHVAGSNLLGTIETGAGRVLEAGGNAHGTYPTALARQPAAGPGDSTAPGSPTSVRIGAGGVEVRGGDGDSGSRIKVGPGGVEVSEGGTGNRVQVGPGGVVIQGDGVPPEPIESCGDLCEIWPGLTTSRKECVSTVLSALDYPVEETEECIAVDTEAQCRSCRREIHVRDRDCRTAFDRCIAR